MSAHQARHLLATRANREVALKRMDECIQTLRVVRNNNTAFEIWAVTLDPEAQVLVTDAIEALEAAQAILRLRQAESE